MPQRTMLGEDEAADILNDLNPACDIFATRPSLAEYFQGKQSPLIFVVRHSCSNWDNYVPQRSAGRWTLKCQGFKPLGVSGLQHASVSCAQAKTDSFLLTAA